MQWIKNIGVGKKIAALIVLAVAFLLCVGFTGYYYLQSAKTEIHVMYSERLLPIQLMNQNLVHSRAVEGNILHLMITSDENERRKILADIEARAQDYNNKLKIYEQSGLDANETKMLKEMKETLRRYREARDPVIQLAMENKSTQAYQGYYRNVLPHSTLYQQQIVDITAYIEHQAASDTKKTEQAAARAVTIMLIMIIAAVLLTALLGYFISRLITVPLKQVASSVQEVADGNLSIRELDIDSRDEVGKVAEALNTMLRSLRGLITQVHNSTQQVAAASEELTASAEQTAIAAGQVAQAVTEVAGGADKQLTVVSNSSEFVKVMLERITKVSDNASIVAVTSQKAAESAVSGDAAIDRAVAQMVTIENTVSSTAAVVEKLGDRSKEIGQIVATISGIAGHTNLLALNAAIEAARAGEQGRGFAVVAEEVRKLAEQSQEAAKQIANLIHEIQTETHSAVLSMKDGKKEVNTGAEVVNAAGKAFKDILTLITQATDQVKRITNEIEQVAQGSKDVDHSMSDIAAISRQTAAETQNVSAATEEQSATMQEISASSQALSSLAESLQTAINKFRL